nr:MAG TPA: hypothetical protein [Caudoviricetes sp.]
MLTAAFGKTASKRISLSHLYGGVSARDNRKYSRNFGWLLYPREVHGHC